MSKQNLAKIAVPVIFVRHNISIPDKGTHQRQPGEEISIKNRFGNMQVKHTSEMPSVRPVDTKNFIAALNCMRDQIMEKEGDEREQFIKTAKGEGFSLSVDNILEYRGVKKSGQRCQRVHDSLVQYKLIMLYSEEYWSHTHTKGRFQRYSHFIEDLEIETIEEYHTNFKDNSKKILYQKNFKVKTNKVLIQCLCDPQTLVFVDKEKFNQLDGVAFNLFLFFCGQNLGNKKKHQIFSHEELTNESHCNLVKGLKISEGRRKPKDDSADKIKKALKSLKEKKSISDYKKIEMKSGKPGYRIKFSSDIQKDTQ